MKKLLAMFLSVLFVLSMLPAAMAEETAAEDLPFHRVRTIITMAPAPPESRPPKSPHSTG